MSRPFGAAVIATSLLLSVPPLLAQTPRPTGQVGEYTPPRDWPARQHPFDLLHQRIAVSFDLDRRSLSGDVTTRLIVTGPPTDTIRLDASNLHIDRAADARGHRLRFTADTAGVTVRLARRAATGDTVVFSLAYHGKPERGMYFVPRRRVVWTQGEAIETRSWVPTYDAPNDKTTWEILVTADTGMQVLSNGRLKSVTRTPDGAKQVWDWSQDLPASTYLYSIVAGPFTVLHDQWRGIPVDYYTYPDTVDAAWRTFGETPAMIELYSRILGVNYPWAKYDQSIIPDFTYGGMENVSATTQTDLALHGAGGEPERSARGLNAHELAHQWFGDLATTASWAHAWLNEGLTTYMASVQEEHSRGREAAEWNWDQQQQAAMAADLRKERPLVQGPEPGHDPMEVFFTGHVYPKGAQVAHQLRRLLGDSVFWAGMHRYLVDNAYKPVTTADYAVAMEKASGRDLDWFFDQWCYGIGYPRVSVTRAWDPGSHTLTLTVQETQRIDATHPFFRFPATIRVTTRDSVVRHDIMVTEQNQSFPIALPGDPIEFRFDEGGWLLGTVTTDQTVDELARMAEHDLEFRARYWALRRLDGDTAQAARDARHLIALNDENPHMRQEALRQLEGDKAARDLVRAALADPSALVRGQAVETLATLDSAAVQQVASDLIQHDHSFYVQERAIGVFDPRLAEYGDNLLLDRMAHGGSMRVRLAAARRVLLRPNVPAAAALEAMTDASEPRTVRTTALNLLSRMPDTTRAIYVAKNALTDPDPLFAAAAVRDLARIGGDAGKAALRQELTREDRVTVRAAIQRALEGE